MRNTALRQARVARGWSQQDLAEHLAVHRSTVIRWEYGMRPERFHREKLCDLFGVSATLLGFSSDPNDIKTSDTRRTSDPLWYQPYQRNPFFTGREEILKRLHENLKGHQAVPLTPTAALSGLGGIGKTQTAIEYAYRYGHEYSAVFWISAETYDMVASSFVGIADLLNLPEAQEQDQKKVIASVTRWLVNNNDWLLIFDNVEDLDLMKSILPSARSGSLLFTSRRQSLGFSAHRLNLEQMSLEEGMRFLLHRARMLEPTALLDSFPFEERALVREIVTVLDGLPLALDQAGAYIEATHCRFSDYLSLFHASPLRLLDERETSMDHPQSMVRTLKLAFEQVERSHPIAADLLMVCAFLASEAIPETFFIEGATHIGAPFDVLAHDPFAFQTVIKTLLTYSLIQRNVDAQTITIDRLVQVVLKGRLSKAVQHQWETRVLNAMAYLFPIDPEEKSYRLNAEQFLPHALVSLASFEQESGNEQLYAFLLIKVAAYFQYCSRLTEATPLFQHALHLLEMSPDPDHLMAKGFNDLASNFRMQGKFDEAEELYQQALSLWIREYGPNHLQVSKAYNNLANLYENQGRYEEAELLYLQALSLREQLLEPTHPQIAIVQFNLAILYLNLKRFIDAEVFFERALHIWEQAFGPEHVDVLSALDGLACTNRMLGNYEKAEQIYLQALSVWERVYQFENIDAAEMLLDWGIFIEIRATIPRLCPITNMGYVS